MNEEERRAAGRRREDRRKPEQAANWYAKELRRGDLREGEP
jgi:hypothetical protein